MKIASVISISALFFTSVSLCFSGKTAAAECSNAPPMNRNHCVPIDALGTDNLDRYKYSVELVPDEVAGTFTLIIHMKHDPSLPTPVNPSNQCVYGGQQIAPEDGLPYFQAREGYERVPDYIRRATGIDHISIDYHPCGHEPFEKLPHYDINFYLVPPSYRACMTCETIPNAPVCDKLYNQITPNGKAFFVLARTLYRNGEGNEVNQLTNMPRFYDFDPIAPLQFYGGHSRKYIVDPESQRHWDDGILEDSPQLSQGTYNGQVMRHSIHIAKSFMTDGNTMGTYDEPLEYIPETTTLDSLITRFVAVRDQDLASPGVTVTAGAKSFTGNPPPTMTSKKGSSKSRSRRYPK